LAKEKEVPEKKKSKGAVLDSSVKPPVPATDTAASPAAIKPATKSMKVGKLLPKNKARLPRRQKKARQKAAGRL
jgi:hypothetical protein